MEQSRQCPSFEACFFASFIREADHIADSVNTDNCTLLIDGQERSIRSFLQRFIADSAERLGRTAEPVPQPFGRCSPCVLTRAELEIDFLR
jgi:hypothetical protein